jgi:hypothetical protein
MNSNYQSSADSMTTLNIVHEHEPLTGLGLGSQSLPYPDCHNFQPLPRYNPQIVGVHLLSCAFTHRRVFSELDCPSLIVPRTSSQKLLLSWSNRCITLRNGDESLSLPTYCKAPHLIWSISLDGT